MLMKALKSLATNGDHPSKRHVMQKFDWVHSSRYEFNMFCDENGVKSIFHTTSWPCVSSILQSAVNQHPILSTNQRPIFSTLSVR